MEIRYKKCFVAFIDILGFKEKISQTEANPGKINEIYSAFSGAKMLAEAMRENRQKAPLFTTQATMFSDSIVVSTLDMSIDSFRAILAHVCMIQSMYSMDGFFVRGCISVGEHYHDDNVLYGPALVKAYNLERIASWPRVIIDPEVFSIPGFKIDIFTESRFCKIDTDGLVFTDYLTKLFEVSIVKIGESNENILLPEIQLHQHKDVILNELKTDIVKSDLTVLLKYKQLANYHNLIVEEILDRYAKTPQYVTEHRTVVNDYCEFNAKEGRSIECSTPEQMLETYKVLVLETKINMVENFPLLYGKY